MAYEVVKMRVLGLAGFDARKTTMAVPSRAGLPSGHQASTRQPSILSSIRLALQWTLVAIGLSCWFLLLWAWQPGDRVGTDFYPIYYAGVELRHGMNPYGSEAQAHLQRVWQVPFAAAGNAYPLPAIIGFCPLVLLPLPLAVTLWTMAGSAGAFAAIRLRSDWRAYAPLLFLFMPLHRAIVMKQATLIWFAIVIVLLFAMRRRQAMLAGWAIAMLPAKPQVGLLFALAGVIWAWREQRWALPWAVNWTGVIWGLSFALHPDWVSGWIASVRRYDAIVQPASLAPWGLLAPLLMWRLPWWSRLAALQVVVFPVSDVYGALPLLLVWLGIGGPLALIGAGLSWLWVLLRLPNSVEVFWIVILAPLILAAVWQQFVQRKDTPQSIMS